MAPQRMTGRAQTSDACAGQLQQLLSHTGLSHSATAAAAALDVPAAVSKPAWPPGKWNMFAKFPQVPAAAFLSRPAWSPGTLEVYQVLQFLFGKTGNSLIAASAAGVDIPPWHQPQLGRSRARHHLQVVKLWAGRGRVFQH